MTSKVRSLQEVKLAPDEGAIECLENLLRLAKNGEIHSFAFAAQGDSGSVVRGHNIGKTGRAQVVCAIAEIMQKLCEDRD